MTPAVYYNEIDPFCIAWLRELMAEGVIPLGDIDDRSIWDVLPTDLRGYTHCHFFAGIGGWAYAARLAGWPDDRPLWTGSCPCQPFSAAGQGKGIADERHLWPAFHWLIDQCRPPVIAGEQVDAALRHGWVDLVQADLEGSAYSVGWADLPAACVGAPHIRQRLWFVAQSSRAERRSWRTSGREADRAHAESAGSSDAGRIREFWDDAEWLPCRDGKYRPTQPGIFPLAHGVPHRVGTLRGAGNAIVPQVAAEFLKALLDD